MCVTRLTNKIQFHCQSDQKSEQSVILVVYACVYVCVAIRMISLGRLCNNSCRWFHFDTQLVLILIRLKHKKYIVRVISTLEFRSQLCMHVFVYI